MIEKNCSLLDIKILLLFPRNPFHVSHQGVLGGPVGPEGPRSPGGPSGPGVPGLGPTFPPCRIKSSVSSFDSCKVPKVFTMKFSVHIVSSFRCLRKFSVK